MNFLTNLGQSSPTDTRNINPPPRTREIKIDQVLTADTVPKVVEAKIALQDDKEPIIFIICKGMKDKFMNFLANLGQSSPKSDTRNINPPPTSRETQIDQVLNADTVPNVVAAQIAL